MANTKKSKAKTTKEQAKETEKILKGSGAQSSAPSGTSAAATKKTGSAEKRGPVIMLPTASTTLPTAGNARQNAVSRKMQDYLQTVEDGKLRKTQREKVSRDRESFLSTMPGSQQAETGRSKVSQGMQDFLSGLDRRSVEEIRGSFVGGGGSFDTVNRKNAGTGDNRKLTKTPVTTPSGYYDRPDFNTSRLETYSRQADGWGKKLEEIGGQRTQRQRELEGMAAEIRWLQQEQIPALQKAAQEAGSLAEIMAVKNQADRASARLDALLASYTTGRQELEGIDARYGQVLESYNTAVSGFESEYAKYRQGQDEWRKTVRTDRDAIQQDLDAATAARKRVEERNLELTDRIAALQMQGVEANQRELGQLQSRLYVNEAQLRDARKQEQLLQDELDYSTYFDYESYRERADFAEKSKYRADVEDLAYKAINRDEEAQTAQQAQAYTTAGYLGGLLTGLDKTERQQMTDDEIAMYNYLYATDPEKAEEYLEWLTGSLYKRQRQEREKRWAEEADKNLGSRLQYGAASTVLSVPLKAAAFVGQLVDYEDDGKIDQNAPYNIGSHFSTAVRRKITEHVGKKGGKPAEFLYQTMTSMADFLYTTAITGGFGNLGGAMGTIAENASLLLMSSGAAADSIIESKDKGYTDEQALTLGVIDGFAEYITEKVSLEALLKGDMSNYLQFIRKNILAEGSEEVASDFINLFADILVMQDQSEWKKAVEHYEHAGYSEGEAFGRAVGDQAAQMGLSFLGGALSGGVMGGAAVAINALGDARYGGQINQADSEIRAKAIKGLQEGQRAPTTLEIDGMTRGLIETGLSAQRGTEARTYAEKLLAKAESGQELTNYELGRMAQLNDAAAAGGEMLPTRITLPTYEENVAREAKENAAGETAAESTNIDTDPAGKTVREREIIREYRDAVDDGLVQFVRDSVENKGANKGRYELEPVSERAAADILEKTGVDVTGFRTVIEQRMAEHIYDEHGPNGTADQSMADLNDIGRLQYVLDNYDRLEAAGHSNAYTTNKSNGRSGLAQTVQYSKAVDGTYYVIEAVPDTKAKTTYIVSAYISNNVNGENTSVYPADAEASRARPGTQTQQMVSSPYPTISQPGETVNGVMLPTAENLNTALPTAEYSNNQAENLNTAQSSNGQVNQEVMQNGAEQRTETQDAGQLGVERQASAAEQDGRIILPGGERAGDTADGDGGWVRGTSTRGQAGILAEGTEGARKRSTDAGRAALERANLGQHIRSERVNVRETLGVTTAAENATVRVIAQEDLTEDLGKIFADNYKRTGKPTVFILEPMLQEGGGYANGAITDERIIVQANNVRYSPEQISDHEVLHEYIRNDPGMRNAIEEAILENYDRETFGGIVDEYIQRHRSVYESAEIDTLTELAKEELFCDAFAGMNKFVQHAERYQETVRNTVAERGNPVWKQSRQNAAATERTNGPPGDGRYSVSESYANDVQDWYDEGMPAGERFVMGSTGDVLQGLGAIESDIYINGDKITDILNDHPEMTIDEIKQIPGMLDDPVLILKSRNVGRDGRPNTRLAIFSTIKAKDGRPVMTVLDLRPIENNLIVEDMQRVTSAYTKDVNPVGFIESSDILHADKKRTIPLLRSVGFKMPIELLRNGSIGSIDYSGTNVNINGVPFEEVVREETTAPGNMLPGGETTQERFSAEDEDTTAPEEAMPGGESSYYIEENIRTVYRMDPVAELSGDEFKKGETDLISQVVDYYNSIGGSIATKQLGNVALDRRGVKADVAHGIGRVKAAAFRAVPEVLQNGEIIDYEENWKGRGYETYVFAAPITIGGDRYFEGVVVTRARDNNRLYLHEVLTEKEGRSPFKTGAAVQSGKPGGEYPSIFSLLQKVRNVKNEMQIGPAQVTSDNFKRWFGDWQNDPANASKVVNEDGTPKVVYHQTAGDFWSFDNNNPGAGKYDSETPNGFFFKDNDHDIGIGGERQVAVYLNMRNPLRFSTRDQANAWYADNIEGYRELQDRMNTAMQPYNDRMQAIEDEMFKESTTDEQYEVLNAEWDELLEELRAVENDYRGQLRELLNGQFLNGNSGYDGIILDYDGHRYVNGKRENVKSYIVFDRTQIKSATDNVGSFDESNPDIRYSVEDGSTEYAGYGIMLPGNEIEEGVIDDGEREMGDRDLRGRTQYKSAGGSNTERTEGGRLSQRGGQETGIGLYSRNSRGNALLYDNEGRGLAAETAARIQNTAVSDADGKPIATYHFTPENDFDTFERGDIGFHFGTEAQSQKRAKDLGAASGRTIRAYLNITNPIRARLDINSWFPQQTALYVWSEGYLTDSELSEIQSLKSDGYDSPAAVRLRELLEAQGYDGIVYPNGVEGKGDSYIAFHDDQIIRAPIEEVTGERFSMEDDQTVAERFMAWSRENPNATSQEAGAELRRIEREQQRESRKAKQQETEKPPKLTKPPQESRPIIAKRELRQSLERIFSIPSGMKKSTGDFIDQYADKLLKKGSMTMEDRETFFNHMYETGVVEETVNDAATYGRSLLKGRKFYVNDTVREELGDDWNEWRKRAMAAGFWLTNDQSDPGLDMANQELSEIMPGLFNPDDTDLTNMLQTFVQVAEEGKAEQMPLAEYVASIAEREYVSEDEVIRDYQQQMERELDKFAEKANLEVYLRDRTGIKIAEERAKYQEALAREREKYRTRRAMEQADRQAAMEQARERRDLREMQQRTLRTLKQLKKMRNKTAPELQPMIDQVLGDLDLYAIGAANELRYSKRYDATWGDIAEMYAAYKQDEDFIPNADLERIMQRVMAPKIGDMTVEDLQDRYNAAVGLLQNIYNRNRLLADEYGALISEVTNNAAEDIRNAPIKGGEETTLGKIFNTMQLTPMNMLERMAGWNPDSDWMQLARKLEDGERKRRKYIADSQGYLADEFVRDNADWVKKADGQGRDAIWYQYDAPEITGWNEGNKPMFSDRKITVWFTPAQKVHMALESKNIDNLRHMMGGRTFPNKELYSKGKTQEAFAQGTTVKLDPATVRAMVSSLTPEEQALYDALEPFYNQMQKVPINETSMILNGYEKATEANYAPIFTNKNYTKSEPGIFDMTAEGIGSLKERVVSFNPSYQISAFDAFDRSVKQAALYIGMAIPVRDMNAVLNKRTAGGESMKDVITHKWSNKQLAEVEDLLTELQGGRQTDIGSIEELTNSLLNKYISATFGFNPSIVLKQSASFPLAGAYLGMRNMPNLAKALRVSDELINTYTGELAYRTLGYATPETAELKKNPNRLQQSGTVGNFIFGGGAITWMDGVTVKTMWSWAENKVRREQPDLDIGTQEEIDSGSSPFYQAVAREFNEAVSRSQPMYDTMHRAEIMREGGALNRTFTLFKTVPMQEYNMTRQAIGEAQYYKKTGADSKTQRAAARKVGSVYLSIAAGNLMIGAITLANALLKNKAKKYRDDDDELTTESVMLQFARQWLQDGAGIMLFGDTAAEIIGNILTGDKWYGLETPGIGQLTSILEQTIKAGSQVKQLIIDGLEMAKDGGDFLEYLKDNYQVYLKAAEDIARTVGTYATGLPIDNLRAYLLGTIKWIAPEINVAYEDAVSKAKKAGLSGLTGEALEMRMESVLEQRLGDLGDVDENIVQELSRLYEAGYPNAVPSAEPEKISINGEEHQLTVAQQQQYGRIWSSAIGESLKELVGSVEYQQADEETRAAALKVLYAYGHEQAKEALFPEYKRETSAADRAMAAGATLAEWAMWSKTIADMDTSEKYEALLESGYDDDTKIGLIGGMMQSTEEKTDAGNLSAWGKMQSILDSGLDVDQYIELKNAGAISAYMKNIENGLNAKLAYNAAIAIKGMDPEGDTGKAAKWRLMLETSGDQDEQIQALSTVMYDSEFEKLQLADSFGFAPEVSVILYETLPSYDLDGNGSYKQDEYEAAIDAMSGGDTGGIMLPGGNTVQLTNEERAALWQIWTGSKSAKNNPYDTDVGQAVIDARAG